MQISSTASDFKQTFDEFHSQIEETLHSLFTSRLPDSLYHPIAYLFEGGGKRLRPILTMVSAGAVGNNPDDALQCGTAMEILHNFTLVHDDIMDKSPIRRGRETIHKRWNESTAILSGDVMIGVAYNIIISSSRLLPKFDDILTAFTHGLVEVCEGQAMDLDFQHQTTVIMNEYIDMIEHKTARLLEMSAAIGGLVGNGTIEQNEALKKFALHLGIAFQIQDDILDLTAQQHELGKFIGQDIVEGKKTYLIIRATEKAKSEQHRTLLKHFYDEKGLAGESIEQMKTMMDELGVFADAQNEVNRQLEFSCSALKVLPKNYYTLMLEWLTTIVNERKK
ncbi:MAG: polyprenyl synthetase family protein [Ignavibacteriae bacterium]|nr:polyprenyl synthetase family protein [Ignavibacteriota bacterium]